MRRERGGVRPRCRGQPCRRADPDRGRPDVRLRCRRPVDRDRRPYRGRRRPRLRPARADRQPDGRLRCPGLEPCWSERCRLAVGRDHHHQRPRRWWRQSAGDQERLDRWLARVRFRSVLGNVAAGLGGAGTAAWEFGTGLVTGTADLALCALPVDWGCAPRQLARAVIMDPAGTLAGIAGSTAQGIGDVRSDLVSGDPFRVARAVTGIFLVVGAGRRPRSGTTGPGARHRSARPMAPTAQASSPGPTGSTACSRARAGPTARPPASPTTRPAGRRPSA